MEIEYSNEVKGQIHAYRFDGWEKQTIARALRREIKMIEKKIERIDNNPKNEGQADYLEDKRMHRYDIEALQTIIDEFTK